MFYLFFSLDSIKKKAFLFLVFFYIISLRGDAVIVGVLVELSNKNIDKIFDYRVPKELEEKIKIGIRVKVPFGHMELVGFILGIKNEEDRELKEILSVLDEEVILNKELLALGRWMQKEMLCTLISAYQAMLPKGYKASRKNHVNKKINCYIQLHVVDPNIKLNASQQKIIEFIQNKKEVLKSELNKISKSSVDTLLKKGVLSSYEKEVYRIGDKEEDGSKKYELTNDQKKVVSSVLQEEGFGTYLLHGVTGSGKTEVYMELIAHYLKQGKQAIVLVPEISLTPQMVNRFKRRFGSHIAVLHSALSDGEKYDEYRKIVRGEVSIAIGARSAIFAPFLNLGIIIIDEEHTSSYKQENNPKYHAIDVANKRGEYHNCKVVLGSATPRLEDYARAKKNVYHLLELPKRINNKALPKVEIVDMNEAIRKSKKGFSLELIDAISSTLAKGEQVLLLLNRRGYSSFISCASCGYVEKCPNCDISLTYHKTSNTLRCHYCGYGTKVNKVCPHCKEEAMQQLGTGTEKIEEALHKLFEDAKVIRMDFDTTSKKGAHEKIINAFKNKEYNILLGTQMIAKGLDFEDVTLVGVINADTSLNIPDFRSSEMTFQLLDQVAGRSGRASKKGRVIIQTFNKDHYAIMYAKEHDYIGFFKTEMMIRRQLSYPPYYYITYVKIISKDYTLASKEATKIGNILKQQLKSSIVLGPSVCNVFRVNNTYRFGIIIKYKKEEQLYKTLEDLLEHYKSNAKVKIDIDFNPNSL